MANCSASDVRMILDTGLSDADLTSLITLADEEMTQRGLIGTAWTAALKKQVSMLITASLAAMKQTTSYGKDGSEAVPVPTKLAEYYRQRAEALIAKAEVGLHIFTEPLPCED